MLSSASVVTTKNVFWHCQMFSGKQNLPWLRTKALEERNSFNIDHKQYCLGNKNSSKPKSARLHLCHLIFLNQWYHDIFLCFAKVTSIIPHNCQQQIILVRDKWHNVCYQYNTNYSNVITLRWETNKKKLQTNPTKNNSHINLKWDKHI
jgi:hypothetical protein